MILKLLNKESNKHITHHVNTISEVTARYCTLPRLSASAAVMTSWCHYSGDRHAVLDWSGRSTNYTVSVKTIFHKVRCFPYMNFCIISNYPEFSSYFIITSIRTWKYLYQISCRLNNPIIHDCQALSFSRYSTKWMLTPRRVQILRRKLWLIPLVIPYLSVLYAKSTSSVMSTV